MQTALTLVSDASFPVRRRVGLMRASRLTRGRLHRPIKAPQGADTKKRGVLDLGRLAGTPTRRHAHPPGVLQVAIGGPPQRGRPQPTARPSAPQSTATTPPGNRAGEHIGWVSQGKKGMHNSQDFLQGRSELKVPQLGSHDASGTA